MAPWVLDWLERWATHRQLEEAALALWDGGNGGALAETAMPELSRLAGRYGLSLLLDGTLPGENEAESFARRLEERATFQSSTLLDILEQPSHQDYREWGIND